jgi:Ser/Thr protein kinase RdoA (MazF antagonist)
MTNLFPELPGRPRPSNADIDALLARYGLRRVGDARYVEDSVSCDNFRVPTDRGDRFVRFHRPKRKREQLEARDRLERWAAEQGLPVFPAERDLRGRAMSGAGGWTGAVYPWVEGRPAVRGAITVGEAETLGRLHGRVQAALAEYADPTLGVGGGDTHWDTEQSILALARVDDLIRYYPAVSDEDTEVRGVIIRQLAFLEGSEVLKPEEFAGLPSQVVHGDFHERNVLLAADGSAAALVDWERARVYPRAYELVRALDFMRLTEGPPFEAYVAGYRKSVALGRDECAAAADLYWQSTMHDHWAYTMVFVRGDRAPRRFFAEMPDRIARWSDAAWRAAFAERLAAAAGA